MNEFKTIHYDKKGKTGGSVHGKLGDGIKMYLGSKVQDWVIIKMLEELVQHIRKCV